MKTAYLGSIAMAAALLLPACQVGCPKQITKVWPPWGLIAIGVFALLLCLRRQRTGGGSAAEDQAFNHFESHGHE